MPTRDDRIKAIITEALRDYHPKRRHPCQVAADRLGDHLMRYPEAFDGAARDDIAYIRHILLDIAGDET